MALSKDRSVRIRHDRDMDQRLKKAKQLLGLVEDEYEIATATFRRMASVKLDQHQADAYFAQVFPDPAASNEASSRLAADRRRWAMHFFHEGRSG